VISLEVWGSDHRTLLETARAAEELGFDALCYGESPTALNLETWTTLAFLAARTTSLRLGPVITNLLPSYRSFPLFVRQAHAVAVLSGGRLELRTGTGAASRWAEPWWAPVGVAYPGRAERRADLAAWLEAVHHVWERPGQPLVGDRVGFEGIELAPPVARPPITVAAMGARSMAVAARYADVWEASYLDPDGYRALAGRFEDVAGERAPAVARSLEVDVVTAPTDAGRRRLEARFLAERGDEGPAALARALTGGAAELAERLAAYLDAGVDRFLAACVDPHDRSSLEVLAEAAQLARPGTVPAVPSPARPASGGG
jgi:alkanesulfonate monooxygenase SsuD/methylene tetrahydromethanopterin reductase-like flavin-dependent oxidoreductase (luciferase family)